MKIRKTGQSAGLIATVIDKLTSTSKTDALSANQGKVLDEKITTVNDRFGTDPKIIQLTHSGHISSEGGTHTLYCQGAVDFILLYHTSHGSCGGFYILFKGVDTGHKLICVQASEHASVALLEDGSYGVTITADSWGSGYQIIQIV